MSIYGHYSEQYYGNKIEFPKESFLIAGISFYQKNLSEINYHSKLEIKPEPENKYDKSALQILFNEKCIGYIPNKPKVKKMCLENTECSLKIINIKCDRESKNKGIRVILDKYFTENMKHLGIF